MMIIRIRRTICILTAVLLCQMLPVCGLLVYEVYGAIATDTLTINVGYQGGPFMEKVTYSWKDLDDVYGGALPSHKVVYSYYGGRDGTGGRNVVVSARGFYIKDLLKYAGIDLSSIAGFEFYTDDQKVGAFTTMTKRELLDTPRYYYPNMGIDDEYNQVSLDGGDMSAGAIPVESMFALEDNWEWEGVTENFTSMSSSGRFHLLFGQSNVGESRTGQAAKYVHTINVIFSGAPVIGTESNIELKVGSDYRVQVNVTAADTALENYIKDNLVWSSNNTEVIEVDQYGQLTIKGDGEAVITAVSGDTVGTITITEGNGNGDGSDAGEETGGDKAGETSETPPEGGSAETVKEPEKTEPEPQHEPEEKKPEEKPEEVKEEQVSYSENSEGVYILSSDFMEKSENAEWVNSILQHELPVDKSDGSVMNNRKESMDEDASALVVTPQEQPPMTLVTVLASVCFAMGLAAGPVRYAILTDPPTFKMPKLKFRTGKEIR